MLSRRPDPALIERLDRDIEEMNRLVGGMLELARGLGREAPREVDVQVLLEGLASQAREAGAEVAVNADECTVSAAPMALRRLLSNLVSNAQRYGGRAVVELVARHESKGIHIGVLDRGPGIPPDQIEACSGRSTASRHRAARAPAAPGSGSPSCASSRRRTAGPSNSRIATAAVSRPGSPCRTPVPRLKHRQSFGCQPDRRQDVPSAGRPTGVPIMKGSSIVASLAATVFVFASGAVHAQGQQGSGQQGGGQQGSGQQQMQTRERTQDREQAQAQTQASKGAGEGVYGGNLMTVQERNQYRAELGALKTDEERLEYKARHREKMELRAKERGIDPQVTND
jgi:hypothetical protein